MESLKRICLVTPDRWAGSVALAMREHFPAVEVISVAEAAANQICEKLGIASTSTHDLLEGLKGADLILVPQTDQDSELSLHNVVCSCGNNVTVCGHGRSLAEVNAIILDVSRQDVHYVSVVARGTENLSADVSSSSASDIRSHSIVLTPSKIDDLDALSNLQEHLREIGGRVSAMSPRVHDRQLAVTMHLPRVVLIPIVHYLAESLAGKNSIVSSESARLLEVFARLTPQNAKAWAEELSRSKHHLLPAVDSCLKHLTLLREELGSGQLQERVALLAKQVADLSAETSFAAPSSDPKPPPAAGTSPESLSGLVNSLFTAVERISHGTGDNAPSNTTEMLRELAEHTQAVLERLSPRPQSTAHSPDAESPVVSSFQPAAPVAAETVPAASERPADSFTFAQPEVTEALRAETLSEPAPPRSFDIQCRHELNVMERMARVMAGVHIAVTKTEEMWSEQGVRVIRVTLEDPDQIDRARELLRMAGIPLA